MNKNIDHKNEEVNPLPEKQLPAWHFEEARGCPNVILRSALFGVVGMGGHNKTERSHCHKVAVASTNSKNGETETSVNFSGDRLSQDDLDLWLEILHLVRVTGDKTIQFSARSMLRALGDEQKNINGRSFERLTLMLNRLLHSHVRIVTREAVTSTHLIMSHTITQKTKEIQVQLHEDVIDLFAPESWTAIQIKNRRELDSQLARWLHGFYLTHRAPFQYKISTLKKLSGSSADFSHFKYMLKSALKELSALPGWELEIVPGIKNKEDPSDLTGEKVSCKHPALQYEEPEKELPAPLAGPSLPAPLPGPSLRAPLVSGPSREEILASTGAPLSGPLPTEILAALNNRSAEPARRPRNITPAVWAAQSQRSKVAI